VQRIEMLKKSFIRSRSILEECAWKAAQPPKRSPHRKLEFAFHMRTAKRGSSFRGGRVRRTLFQ
jgi:hypothetical protein